MSDFTNLPLVEQVHDDAADNIFCWIAKCNSGLTLFVQP